MKNKLLTLILLIILLSSGCVSTGKKATVLDFIDQKEIDFKPYYNVVHNYKTDSIIPLKKSGPIGKLFGVPRTMKWEEMYSSRVSEEELKKIWHHIQEESNGVIINSSNPDYYFDIELKAVYSSWLSRFNPMDIDCIGFSLFKLTVTDHNSNYVHGKTFKVFGVWNSNGMSIKGPLEMGYRYPNLAIAKLGLYDVLSYIRKGEFLTEKSWGTKVINHDLPNKHPELLLLSLNPFPKDGEKRFYNLQDAMWAYARFIMGEDEYVSSEDIINAYKGKDDTLSQLVESWFESDPEKVKILMKMAHQLRWPHFPELLEVEASKYKIVCPSCPTE